MVDPLTNVKQIVGRFRANFETVHHITNYHSRMHCKDEQFIRNYFEAQKDQLNAIHTLYKNEENEIKKLAHQNRLASLKIVEMTYLYNGERRFSYYLVDNEVESEKVKKLYTDRRKLSFAYSSDSAFKLISLRKHYKEDEREKYLISKLNKDENVKDIFTTWEDIYYGRKKGRIEDHIERYKLEADGGFTLSLTNFLSREDLEEIDYKFKEVKKLAYGILDEANSSNYGLIALIYQKFKIGKRYSRAYIKKHLESLFEDYGVNKSTKATQLGDYCKLSGLLNMRKGDHIIEGEKRPKGFLIEERYFRI